MSAEHVRLAAEFDSGHRLRAAVDRLVDRGVPVVDAYAPYELEGLSEALRLPRSPLPRIAFAAAVVGAVLGYGIQWYVNAWDYPLNAGGRPPHAAPSFVYITFETLVLCAACAVFVGLLVRCGLPRYYHPFWDIEGAERASLDRFWVVVEPRGEDDRRTLEALTPLRILGVERDRA